MGLFSKKEPCCICGGKVSGLFPDKIQGHLICKDCHGTVDLPDNAEKNMTVEQFKGYIQFRSENQQLRQNFVVSTSIDTGFFGTKIVIDCQHGLFCFDPNLNATIFTADQLESLTVREDSYALYEANAKQVLRYESAIPDRAMSLEPEVRRYAMERRRYDDWERMHRANDNGPGGPRGHEPPPPPRPMDLPKPVRDFVMDFRFRHPYWGSRTITMGGPDFSAIDPTVDDYLRQYNEKVQLLENLVLALAQISFPSAPKDTVPLR